MLNGKKGVVFGVANDKSIAYGVAQRARALGAQLVASCLNQKAFDAVTPLMAPLQIPLKPCNVETPGELAAFADFAAAELGEIDFLVHSIAWAPLAELHGRVIDSSPEGFARTAIVSCHSFAQIARVFAPKMSRGGALVTMSYLGAEEAVAHYGLMGPIKAALESLVRYMACELGEQNIRVHAVSPGPILTRAASGIEGFDELLRESQRKAPLRRLVQLEEIANLTAFLCSDLASGMTGQTIFVDAGRHATA